MKATLVHWMLAVVMALLLVPRMSARGEVMTAASAPGGDVPARVLVAQARVRPNRIQVIVSRSGIALDNDTPGTTAREKVWALPGGNVIFVVENTDTVRHSVSIPLNDFNPAEPHKDATPDPLVAAQTDKVDVQAGGRGVIVFRVRPLPHFRFDRPPWKDDPLRSMTYKYNIHTIPDGGKRITLDPDIEIDQP